MTEPQVLKDPYLPIIQPQLAPAWIDHVCRFQQKSLPRQADARSFRYIDLGCGRGLTLLCLAAAYGEARFMGIDANPEHIEYAQGIAARAGLHNIDFLTAKFGDSSLRSIPPAHYVVADGIYTWIPQDVRADLVSDIDRMLLPGGAAVISANLMSGWLALLPVQRLLEDMQSGADGEPADTIEDSRGLIKKIMLESRSSILQGCVDVFETLMSEASGSYTVHEFLPKGWQPVWTADVVRHFLSIGCRYIGNTDLRLLRDEYSLTGAQRQLLREAGSDIVALTMRDSMVPQYFTRLLFQRTALQQVAGEGNSLRMDGWLALAVDTAAVRYECYTTVGKLTFDSPTAHRIINRLADGPAMLSDLFADENSPGEDIFFKIVDSLCASKQIIPVDPPRVSASVERLNKILDEEADDISYRANDHGTPLKTAVWAGGADTT